MQSIYEENGVKGVSRFNKKELNEKMLDVSEKNFKTRKMKISKPYNVVCCRYNAL